MVIPESGRKIDCGIIGVFGSVAKYLRYDPIPFDTADGVLNKDPNSAFGRVSLLDGVGTFLSFRRFRQDADSSFPVRDYDVLSGMSFLLS